MRRAVLIAVAVVALTACNGDDDSGTTATTVPVGPTGTHTTATAFPGAVTPVSTPAAGEVRELRAVRVGSHDGFDRVVFEFTGAVPGYSVKYIERPVIADGSGEEVTVKGDAVLEVRLEPATAHTIGQRTGGAGDVSEVVKTGDFEAVVHFAVGVAGRQAFHVVVSERSKLIVDVASG